MRRTTHRYGPAHAQVAEVWRPAAGGARPVVVLIHGGFWRQVYTKRLMHRMAAAIVARGWVAYNIEYRRVGALGAGGWPATFDDVSDAMDALAGIDGVDLDCVVTCGHSAGGHLALWAAGSRDIGTGPRHHPVSVRAAIALAGVVDLELAARQGLGAGAVDALMGGGPDEHPERYRLGSPAALLPLGVAQHLIHGTADGTVPAQMSVDYAERATAAEDDATAALLPGVSHLAMIAPSGAAFAQVATILDQLAPPTS